MIASIQKVQEKLEWQTATASLLQEYKDQLLMSGGLKAPHSGDEGHALAATGGSSLHVAVNGNYRTKTERRGCFE